MSIPAHNVPFQVNFDNTRYRSLSKIQGVVGGREKFHMTVVFAQMEDGMIRQKVQTILKDIKQSPECKDLTDDVVLRFKRWKLLGARRDILAAEYEPVNTSTGRVNRGRYMKDFVGQARRMVRRAADQMQGGRAARSAHMRTAVSPDSEVCTVDGRNAYIMDTREPLLHITVKRGASQKDIDEIERRVASGELVNPADLKIRLADLSADATRKTRI